MIDVSVHQKKLELLNKWIRLQIEFRDQRRIGFENGFEFMGNGSQFWPFEFWYKVRIGEIKSLL